VLVGLVEDCTLAVQRSHSWSRAGCAFLAALVFVWPAKTLRGPLGLGEC